MTKILKFIAALLLALPLFSQAQAQRTFSQPELDQMLAPVALYPDPLLSQVLMAATYPEEVAEAARWSRANPGLQGDDAVRAVESQDWDPSVKSLVAFPQILQRMAENPGWTQSLGDAFLAQEPHVMDTVQQLRRRAQAAGNLRSDEQIRIEQQGPTILVQPASPQYVYVPYYDPYVVYGPWWWPTYQPVYWSPWPRPVRVYVSLGFFFGAFDWHHRHARVAYPNAYYYRSARFANRTLVATPQRWQADPQRRAAFVQRQAVQERRVEQRVEPRVEQRVERRMERNVEQRVERRVEQRAAPVQVQSQPQVQHNVHPRVERRIEPRVERREERREARQAQPQPQQRMPAAVAPQTPRIERQAQRQEQRQERREARQERGQKG